jgi:hypothetical protein
MTEKGGGPTPGEVKPARGVRTCIQKLKMWWRVDLVEKESVSRGRKWVRSIPPYQRLRSCTVGNPAVPHNWYSLFQPIWMTLALLILSKSLPNRRLTPSTLALPLRTHRTGSQLHLPQPNQYSSGWGSPQVPILRLNLPQGVSVLFWTIPRYDSLPTDPVHNAHSYTSRRR